MLDYDFDESIGYWLISTAENYRLVVEAEVTPHGITYRQCQVLALLALESPLSQAQLAQRMNIEPPTLVGILDRMERDGWIRREGCPTDRRKKHLYATPEAEPVWEKIVACAKKVREQASAGLTPEQLATLKELLAIVKQNLTAPEPVEVEKGN